MVKREKEYTIIHRIFFIGPEFKLGKEMKEALIEKANDQQTRRSTKNTIAS